jgi:hypothetical protein
MVEVLTARARARALRPRGPSVARSAAAAATRSSLVTFDVAGIFLGLLRADAASLTL